MKTSFLFNPASEIISNVLESVFVCYKCVLKLHHDFYMLFTSWQHDRVIYILLHFYIVKLGFTEVYIIFLFLL